VQKVAALHAWQDVGHYPATFRQPNGGAFAVAVNAWLDWHLKGGSGGQPDVRGPRLRVVQGQQVERPDEERRVGHRTVQGNGEVTAVDIF